jgi:capsular exopolysaccharide synthesis family protein
MDGTHHDTAPTLAHVHPHALPSLPPNPASVKAPSDYARALRRRFWLVLMVGVPMAVAATVYVLRQPAVYQAEALISIVPPQSDPEFQTLVARNGVRRDSPAQERYLADKVAAIRGKRLAEQVVNDPAFIQATGLPTDDAVEELLYNLRAQSFRNSNYVRVTLDGTDPTRTAGQLALLIERFADDAKLEAGRKIGNNQSNLEDSLVALQNELKAVEQQIGERLKTANYIGPEGKNFIQAQYENVGVILLHKRMRLDEAEKQSWVAQLFPKFENSPDDAARRSAIAELQGKRRKLYDRLQHFKSIARNAHSDPGVREASRQLQAVLSQIEELQQVPAKAVADPSEMIVTSLRKEIQAIEETSAGLLDQLKKSIPEFQSYVALQDKKQLILKRIYDLETNISEYKMLARTQDPPVTVISPVTEPTKPSRSQKPVKIALALFVSFGLGLGLVCLLEHLDHSVKVPEHLTIGLTLPLLGVIPRIRRTALVHRGGHLWTPGDPNSVEADAYRNLRASLLGASDRLGPVVTLLVTSAKAGEGKSTTALNLAATCARAGERTLLMDVDLRRPSLAEVFHDGDGGARADGGDGDGTPRGLVDVLRGRLPWQRTVVRSDIPNLDFLPTGDARGVPIEILGTLELRQLLLALASHYDRVILDGPAVLGLADCRMLGRVVDASLLVVRSGTHEMRPLQRAKAMLEQSHVLIAGVVFNGLYDDLQNWSSYGPYAPYALGGHVPADAPAGLGAPVSDAVPLAGSVEG